MNQDEPLLGLATTKELLDELEARFKVDQHIWAYGMVIKLRSHLTTKELAYSTVGKRRLTQDQDGYPGGGAT